MFEALNGELRVEAVQTLNAKTLCPVSIASHRGGIFLFFRDFRRVHLHQWLPDHNHLQDLPEPTGTIYPVLAANDRDMFHVVHNKLTGDRTFESISPGAPAPHRQTANLADAIFVHYPSAPAAAMWGDRHVAVCTSGMWDKIRIVGWQHGRFLPPVELGRSRYPRVDLAALGQYRLAATTVGTELVVGWITRPNLIRPRLEMVWTRAGDFGKPTSVPNVDGISDLCELDGELVVAWVARRRSYIGFLRNGHLVPALSRPTRRRHVVPGAQSSWFANDIRLCNHDGYLLATGVGPDRQVQVTRLRRP